MDKIEIPSQDIEMLEKYLRITHNEPVAISLDMMPKILALTEELKIAEKEDASKLEKINKMNEIIQEKMIQVEALRGQLNQKLLWLKEHPEAKLKPITNGISKTIKEEFKDITEENILKVLKEDLVYGGGNSQIAKALHIENPSKGVQQKIYTVCKNSDKIISANRGMWKLK